MAQFKSELKHCRKSFPESTLRSTEDNQKSVLVLSLYLLAILFYEIVSLFIILNTRKPFVYIRCIFSIAKKVILFIHLLDGPMVWYCGRLQR